MNVVGVDFSGAKTDNRTWITEGELSGTELILVNCQPITRAELTDMLASTDSSTVVALDFPFSVPEPFAKRYYSHAEDMPDLWDAFSQIVLSDFIEMRDEFVASHGEVKRVCDAYYPESYSCLHKGRPNMLPMTFYGMQMLATLWKAGCDVPPLESQGANRPLLLEVMPGAVLRSLKLPFKGYKSGMKALENRQHILDNLASCQPVSIANLDDYRSLCMYSDDCLDSIVAAVAACLWQVNKGYFRLPENVGTEDENPTVQLEGWLYAPSLIDL